jgi:putative two-component system response regulator
MRPEAEFLLMAQDIAIAHHERYNGEGYPHRLQGEEIPLCGRIVSLADVYDALTSKRVYKPAYTHETARTAILAGCGTQFDPEVVQAFLNREEEFIRVGRQLHDGPQLASLSCVERCASPESPSEAAQPA